MFDHQVGKPLPVNQYYLTSDLRNIATSILGESGGRNKNAIICLLRLQRTGKLHDVRPSNGVAVPALCLNVNDIEPKLVFFDYPVYPTIATFPNGLTCVGSTLKF
jgi:hypothetical protein